MHANEIRDIITGVGSTPGRAWPPRSEADRWERVRYYRRRYENDAGQLFSYRTDLHVAEDPVATEERQRTFTPVPLARDIARFSASLLFSEPPKIRLLEESTDQVSLDELVASNDLPSRLLDAADQVAAEGSGALRVVVDDDANDGKPLILFEPEDSVLWCTRYGVVEGGVVIVTVEEQDSQVVYRLLEEHSPGFVRRALFRGTGTRLGTRTRFTEGPPEFRTLKDEFSTGVDRPTLVRWQNVPGGHSDISGLESLLDELDEGESIGREKMRASQALTFVHRKLADNAGRVNLRGAILVGEDEGLSNPIEEARHLVEVAQPAMQADDHVRYLDHIRELAVSMAGYSLASWGLDHGGSADSGKALKLRQSRTLLTRAGKERMATGAIKEACGVALAMMLGRPEVADLVPEVELADGLPRDEMEIAQTIAIMEGAGAISTRQKIRMFHPEWTEQQIDEEAAAVDEANAPPGFAPASVPRLALGQPDTNLDETA